VLLLVLCFVFIEINAALVYRNEIAVKHGVPRIFAYECKELRRKRRRTYVIFAGFSISVLLLDKRGNVFLLSFRLD